jgi:putative endonuclease
MFTFTYVYVLQSESNPGRFYVGLTDALEERLDRHNRGEVSHTSKHRPWHIKNAIAFRNRERAAAFERYLKTGSGRAFLRRHL